MEPKRALCTGDGLVAGGSAVRRIMYTSEIRLESGSLVETLEYRAAPLSSDLGKLTAEQLLFKGKTVYTQEAGLSK